MQPTNPSAPEQSEKAAQFAGSFRKILLALTGVAFLSVGVAVGFLLQNLSSKTPEHSEAATPHEEEQHADNSEGQHAAVTDLDDHEPESAAESDSLSSAEASPSPVIEKLPSANLPTLLNIAEMELAGTHDPSIQSSREPDEKLLNADKLMRLGNYRNALEHYRSLLETNSSFLPAELRLRMALCEEALGDYRQSQDDYRKVVELKPAIELQEAAILGQARLWCHSGRQELAIVTLFRALLSSGDSGADRSVSQIPHELAVLLAQRVRTEKPAAIFQSVLNDDHLVSPVLHIKPFQIIVDLQNRKLTAAQESLVPVNDISVVERFNQNPEEILVNARGERMSALDLVRRVSNRTGWKVRITEECRQRLQEHTVLSDCINMPLAIVLDAILEPFECIWREEGDAILILLSRSAGSQEINSYRLQAAKRSLRFATRHSADHPWAAASALELARLSAMTGNLDQAALSLSKMLEQYPRSEFQSIGWFNLAKIELLRGRLDDSLTAFYRAADLLMGHPLESLSYLYAGRIQIECDRTRDSISSLTRALVLANGSEYEAMATLQLASAYLMLEHYQRAHEILTEHCHVLLAGPETDQAAFLSELIRYLGTKDKLDKQQASYSLVGALTNLNPDTCFGGHWQILAANAYRDFGMSQQEIPLLRKCLRSSYAYPLQNRARQLMLEDAPELLSEFHPQGIPEVRRGKPAPLYFQTQLKEAETLLRRGDLEKSLQLSRELVEHPQISDEDRRASLRLMGKIYQARGDHEMAIQCFTGVIPKVSQTVPPPTAALPLPSRGVN